ncbi:magnesium/cobalt transporter CorA [Egbenema bharatensis]|uniref:magnesium/cobalt transporter CorA n=1 Tax=Egbenema bharatensis TaxID=3463334 RepID=UPI003A87D410
MTKRSPSKADRLEWFSSEQHSYLREAPDEDEHNYVDYFFDQPGSAPGTLTIDDDAPQPIIFLIDYNPETASRIKVQTPEECIPHLHTPSVSWVDVQGLGSEDILRRLGTVFELHPLVLEDIVNVPQRPKTEEYDDQLLLILRMVTLREDGRNFFSEQVSFILGSQYLLTVQEEPHYDCFGPVRERIRMSKGNIRKHGTDYLLYALLDGIIDGFFPVLERYGEELEELEDEVVACPTRQTLERIHEVKRELLTLRRAVWPQRDAINSLIRDGNALISPEVRVYLRDCYDHIIQILDILETYRELASSLMDVYLSSVSNKMNEIMKVLTIISTIFIPLTFIAGVYGMNFDPHIAGNMPELEFPYAYWICLGVMLTIAISLVHYFKRRGWFDNFSNTRD